MVAPHLAQESREMLGIMEQLRYNSLAHSPATRTRRSSRMRVKLQLVICYDEGHEETVTDVITLRACLKRSRSGCETSHHELDHGNSDPCLGRFG